MNFILLTIDSLRADHLGCYGYHKNTSPNIDRLAESSIVFQRAITNAPYTKPSFKSIMTSTYPFSFEGYHTIKPRVKIAEILQEKGYYTAAFPNSPLLSAGSGYASGFEVFGDSSKPDPGTRMYSVLLRMAGQFERIFKSRMAGKFERIFKYDVRKVYNLLKTVSPFNRLIMLYDRGSSVTQEVLSTLKNNRGKRLFIWAHYMDVHHPYIPHHHVHGERQVQISPREAVDLDSKLSDQIRFQYGRKDRMIVTEAELEKLVDLYDGEIKYVDEQIGFLLDALKQAELFDDTLIIITADHGEEFGEHGTLGHIGFNSYTHIYDELLRVPLIISHPKLGKHWLDDQVSLIDLAPTAIDMLGLSKVEQFQGKSLLPLINGRDERRGAVVCEASAFNRNKGTEFIPADESKIVAYRTKDWKYIYNELSGDEFYCLRDDPQEQHNLVDKEKELAQGFKSQIMLHISKQKALERERVRTKIRELKGLGKI
jgi:arylsulfatase A-like enzyme